MVITITKFLNKMDKNYEQGPGYPELMDNNDILGHFKQRFYIKEGTIYLCGNSLGLCSRDAEESVLQAIEDWKVEGVKLWNVKRSKYYLYSKNLAHLMAPLINVDPDEVAITGSTTINIHQAISTLYKPTKSKYKILVDDLNFPTDRYAVDSQVRLKGYEPKDAVKIVKSRDGRVIKEDDVITAMTNDVALILLSTVLYRSGQILDMEKISHAAREKGIIIGWDLCHAVGAIEIDFKSIEIDFAVWCTYKYLNGGPGATAGIYINKKHFQKVPGLAGWFGNKHETQFQMRQEFEHQIDASGLQIGSPTILSMAALEGSLKLIHEAGISNIRKKSLHLTGYLIWLIETKLGQFGFTIGNSKEDLQRGGHVCAEHSEAYRISLALKQRDVVSDFREPNVIRITPVALYTSYSDVYNLVKILLDIMNNGYYNEFSSSRAIVV